jgi:hypothetical protein
MPLFEQNFTPRYLIRVYSPQSAGETSLSATIPPSMTDNKHDHTTDVSKLPPQDGALQLNEHLRWYPWHEHNWNFTSWTTSLLFALQYALYKRRGAKNLSDLSKISILILDTRDFPKWTFIKDMEIMDVFAMFSNHTERNNLEKMLKLRNRDRGHYFGESFTQGRMNIEGRCVKTTMQRLIDSGLFKLFPKPEEESYWKMWANRVVELRQPFQVSQDDRSTSQTDVRRAIAIAESCFGSCWVIPMAAMILGLKPRKENDSVIVDGFAAMFTGE